MQDSATHYGRSLAVEEKSPWILDHILDPPEEGDRLTTVDEPVVVCQGDIHDWPRQNLLPNHHRPLRDGVHAQNGRLRGVDDWRAEQAAVYAAI